MHEISPATRSIRNAIHWPSHAVSVFSSNANRYFAGRTKPGIHPRRITSRDVSGSFVRLRSLHGLSAVHHRKRLQIPGFGATYFFWRPATPSTLHQGRLLTSVKLSSGVDKFIKGEIFYYLVIVCLYYEGNTYFKKCLPLLFIRRRGKIITVAFVIRNKDNFWTDMVYSD